MEKDKTLTFEELDEKAKEFFIKAAREAHKNEYAEDEE